MKRGDRVRIPKGTYIWGTFKEGVKEAGRTYDVIVLDTSNGWPADGFGNAGMEPFITWPGTGGYWHNARQEDVELVEEGR